MSQRTVDYLVQLLGGEIKPWICVNKWLPETSTKVTFYDLPNPARLITEITESLSRGEKAYICCDSRSGRYSAEGLTQKLQTQFPNLNILCVTSETSKTPGHSAVGFVDDINEDIKNWDVVICSPSIGSGVSIDVQRHFSQVYGIFNGVIPEWEARQGLARVREAVERHIWCKKVGCGKVFKTAGLTNFTEIVKKLTGDFRNSAMLAGLITYDSFEQTIQGRYEPAHLVAFSKIAADVNLCMWGYRESLYEGLLEEGCEIEIINDADIEDELDKVSLEIEDINEQCVALTQIDVLTEEEEVCKNELEQILATCNSTKLNLESKLVERKAPDKVIVRELSQTSKLRKEELLAEISSAKLLKENDFNILDKKILRTREEECLLEKYRLSKLYEEIEISTGLVKKSKNNYHRQIQRHFFLQADPRYRKLIDRKQLSAQLETGGMIYIPDLKNLTGEIQLLEDIDILQWVKTDIEISRESKPLIKYCNSLIPKSEAIRFALGINIDKHWNEVGGQKQVHNPVGMLQDILKCLGLPYTCTQRIDLGNGERLRVYKLDPKTLNDERANIFPRWEAKHLEALAKQEFEPTTLPWEVWDVGSNDAKGRVVIQSRPPLLYIYKTLTESDGRKTRGLKSGGRKILRNKKQHDKPPVDATSTLWKGIKTRIRDAVSGVNSIWERVYAALRGAECVVGIAPRFM